MIEQNKNVWMVYVRCITYNHAPYIEDALNGFTMQETDFPFICVIVDDASTDGANNVINCYLREHFDLEDQSIVRKEETEDYFMVYARHKTNLNCYFAAYLLKYNHYKRKTKEKYFAEWKDNSKYTALCEGDDYWTNPHKLQKQVTFLETHNDYSMCFQNTDILYEDAEGSVPVGVVNDGIVSADDVFIRWTVPTASMLCRSEIESYQTKGNNRILYGDIMRILKCAECGKIWGMKDVMSVYRVHSNSAIHNAVNVKESILKEPHNTKFILDNFDCVTKNIVRKRLGVDYYRCFCVVPRLSFKALYYLCLAFYYNPSYLLNMALKTKMYARRHEKESNNII